MERDEQSTWRATPFVPQGVPPGPKSKTTFETIPNHQRAKLQSAGPVAFDFWILGFRFVWNFGFGILDFV